MQRVDTCEKTFLAGEALESDRLVKLNSSGAIVYADAGDDWIGATTMAIPNAEYVAVRLRNKEGTIELVAAGTISKAANVFGTADGKISATPNGKRIGIALAAATAGAVIEVLLLEDDGVRGIVAGEDLAINRLVKLHTDGTLLYADKDMEWIGITLAAASSAGVALIRLRGGLVTFTAVAVAAIEVGDIVYTAADGKIDDTIATTRVGIAQTAATNDGDLVTVIYSPCAL